MAVNIFIKKVNSTRSIPFKLEVEEEYNEETLAACREALDISEGRIKAKRYGSFQEAMDDLGLCVAEDEPEYGACSTWLSFSTRLASDIYPQQKGTYFYPFSYCKPC